jgi:DNA-binding response OmpR family regulator
MGKDAPLILVVDDDEAVVEFYHFILAAAGYRVATAPNGAHGLRLTEELSPALIVLDRKMPVVGGLEFLHALGQSHDKGKPPVIVESSDNDARDEAIDAGAVLFLPKPVASADLLAAIEVTLEKIRATPAAVEAHANAIALKHRDNGDARERMLANLDPKDRELRL